MSEKNVFYTRNDKNHSALERDVYLELLALELYSYEIVHYSKQKYKYPASICIEFVKYDNRYWEYLNTCLKRFNGYTKESLEGEKGEYLLEIINEEIQDAVIGAVELIKEEKLDGLNFDKNEFENYRINLLSDENKKAHPNLKNLFKEILSITREENIYVEKEKDTGADQLYIYVPKIGDTRLSDFKNKVHAIAKAGLMLEAYKFSKKRATVNQENKYKFKKLVKNITEACENSLINSESGSIIKKHQNKRLAALAKVVVNNNEIIGNNLYLIDESGYQKAVEKHIKKNSDTIPYLDSN
jgi:hypothetical protein